MTKETLFRAIGQASEALVEEGRPDRPAGTPAPWRRYAAAAACLVLVLSAALALPRLRGGEDSSQHFDQGEDSGTDVSPDGSGDGSSQTLPAVPRSLNVEITRLDADKSLPQVIELIEYAALEPMTAEEFLRQGIDVFRGTVEDISYYEISIDGSFLYVSTVQVAVSDWIRGEGADTVTLLLPCWPGEDFSESGLMDRLQPGGEAIFLPSTAAADTGVTRGEGYFCYADLGDYYLTEGIRTLILPSAEGLLFDEYTWTGLDSATLDGAAAYLRSLLSSEGESLRGLADALSARGYQVEEEILPQDFLRGERHRLALRKDGAEASLTVYRYETAAEAEADAAALSGDGYSVRYENPDGTGSATSVEWGDTPHFYRLGNLIVQYIGQEPALLAALSDLCGPSFAGGKSL